ncbi:MAG TPA: hypothetical protein VKV16_10460, partial [Solirubrobacteraceae bacterium]|nr:hypothetical protein [Solirubrobacteraceae bacterium]
LHALGRMRVAHATLELWLSHATAALAQASPSPLDGDGDRRAPSPEAGALALQARVAIAHAARLISTEAARVCGSRGLVAGGTLERARRDLDLFLLQHRLDRRLVQLGAQTLGAGAGASSAEDAR